MQGDLSLKQAIVEYRDIYLAYRNFAERSREEYVNDLEDLAAFLAAKGIQTIGEVKLSHLIHYLADLDKRGFVGSTRKRKAISIKSFFTFLYTEGHTMTNIGKQLILPIVEAREPRYLTTNEIRRLLISAKANKRDLALLTLLVYTGIKLSELTKLTMNDLIKREGNQNYSEIEFIRITGTKRAKERVVSITREVSQALNEYLCNREGSAKEALFLNRKEEFLGERGVEKVVSKYLKIAGIEKASVNSLRHTFGAHQVAKGVDRKTLQKVMGHRDIKSTGKYFQTAEEILGQKLQ